MAPSLSFWSTKLREEMLGAYVYAIIDPRDKAVFYIGQAGGVLGKGNDRPDHHLITADTVVRERKMASATSKESKIIEIWNAGLEPELAIVRRQMSPSVALEVEASLIDHCSHFYSNRKLTNLVRGHGVGVGLLSKENWADILAEPVYPSVSIPDVWLFNIAKQLAANGDRYESVRGIWGIAKPNLAMRLDW